MAITPVGETARDAGPRVHPRPGAMSRSLRRRAPNRHLRIVVRHLLEALIGAREKAGCGLAAASRLLRRRLQASATAAAVEIRKKRRPAMILKEGIDLHVRL